MDFEQKHALQIFCSIKCRKQSEYYSGVEKKCFVCGSAFIRPKYMNVKFCSRQCFFKDAKTSRLGKKNPAYRNGTRINKKPVVWTHLHATRKYGKEFVDKHGYKFCEECGINQSLRFETHHIVFASEKPKHKELHNPKNLILVCIKCHNNFHSGKTHEKRKHLVKQRGLEELFGKEIL